MTAKLKLLGLVMAAAVVLAGCRAEDPKDSAGIHASPEAVHQAICDAIQAKDWKKMAGCWTPESRDMMARDLAVTAGFGLFGVPQSAVQELFKRHGLDDAERKGPKEFDGVDRVAFVGEMLALLEKAGNIDEQILAIAGSTLADLKVEAGKARGDLVTTRDGKEYRQRIEFHQVDGSWLVHLISDATAGQHIMTLQGHTRRVLSVAFSPDGNRLASSSVDGSVRIWDLCRSELMRTVNLMILGHGVPLWAWGLIWGVLSLVVAMPSMVGVFVGLSWGRAVRADREGGDASSIPPRAIGWLFVRAWAISVLFIPPAFALLRTPKGTAFGAAVVGFVLSVFLARASVRGLENAAQQRGEQTASAGEGTHNERNE